MIDALAEIGLFRLCISVETGDANIRNNVMIKNIEQDEIFKMVEAVRRHPQIFLLTDFVMGMPEDTVESLEASCELIANLDTDDITLCIATPYPGTELYRQCVRENLFAHEVEKEKLWMADWYAHTNTNMCVVKP
jgi:tRNA A37 methylthiotransferase MiaB